MCIQQDVQTMDVPFHRQDLTKTQNVVWLIENLKARNAQHPRYTETMRGLLDRATKEKLMKTSHIARMTASLETAS